MTERVCGWVNVKEWVCGDEKMEVWWVHVKQKMLVRAGCMWREEGRGCMCRKSGSVGACVSENGGSGCMCKGWVVGAGSV